MGQGHSLNQIAAGPSVIETSELLDLTFERNLGSARFLRSFRAKHQHGLVVVKCSTKLHPNVSFRHFAEELKKQRSLLKNVPNVLPYQRIRETPTNGYLVRQYIQNSLYDRVSIRPFLENIEKKWIAFQLLCAVRDCHTNGAYHGDIRSENVLVTSWMWVYLTDFASTFKPLYLPADNPAEFEYYYNGSARGTCYVAPERFLDAGTKPLNDEVQWSMDIFSLGCVIAELFTETPTFTYSQIFRYRKGEYDPTVTLLHKVDDDHVRALVSSMIRLNPEERWHAQDYLDEHKGKAFPLYFYQHLHPLMEEITDPSSGRKAVVAGEANNGVSDDRIDRIYTDFEMISASLEYANPQNSTDASAPAIGRLLFPLQVDVPNSRHTASALLAEKGDGGTFILLNVITASIRSAARASSKIRACELLLAFGERIPDEAKLDRVLPYVMTLLDDGNEMVMVAGLRTMTQLLALVKVTSPVNSFLFTQYIFPRLQKLVATPTFRENPIVRTTYASCLASLAETASRFLDMMQALRAEGSLPTADDDFDSYSRYRDAYDSTRNEVLEQFQDQTKVFLTDNDTAVRRAFLGSVSSLCVFFGESRASDVILSHLNTYLNDPDWMLKCAFFKTIVGVAVYIGGASLEEFILPLMLQALADPQEFVVEQALRSLASMAEMGLLQRAKTWELIDTAARFEVHPNMWIKEAASHFVSAATTYLSMADIRMLVAPLVKPYLKVPVSNLTESEILDALKKPLPRAVLDLALQWAGKADKTAFWKAARESRQLSYRASNAMPPVSSVADLGPKSLGKVPKTSEDEQWLGRLRNAGMRGEDEVKILAFREYLWRAAQRGKKDDSLNTETIYDHVVSLTKFGITPQTIIFDEDEDIYNYRKLGQNVEDLTLEGELQEATTAAQIDGPKSSKLNGISEDANGLNINSNDDAKSDPPQLPILRRQTSGSGQSLSSSPSSGIGLLGKDKAPPSQSKSSAARMLSGTDLKNKTLPEVATDDATAAGKLNTPTGSRRQSTAPHSNLRKKSMTKISASRAGHNYAGNDPTVLRLLDTVYVDSFPTDNTDFGPMLQPMKRDLISSSSSHATGPWRPQGQLVAVLGEHTDSVTRIAVAPDHTFFVTGSDDGFFKVWDTTRLETNVSHRSRHSQSIGAGIRVTSLCFIDLTHSFVCTGSDGSVHFLKVQVTETEHGPKYGGIQELRIWHIPSKAGTNEYAVWSEHIRAETGSTLVLATNLGRILALDLRYMTLIYDFQNPAQHGTPTCFCISRRHDWILVGTSHGVLDLWDLRFRLRLRSYAFPAAAPITRLQIHPSRKSARRNRVCVSGGTARGEVSVWDIEKGFCHEIYRAAHPHSKINLDIKDYKLLDLADDRAEGLLTRVTGPVEGSASEEAASLSTALKAPALKMSSYFSIYPPTNDSEAQHAFVITGGPDGKVRFWDCDRLEGCRIVSGGSPGDKPSYTYSHLGTDLRVLSEKAAESPVAAGNTVESNRVATPGKSKSAAVVTPKYDAIRTSAQQLLSGHLDTVMDVALLERPFGMVVSADRSGQVFVHQ